MSSPTSARKKTTAIPKLFVLLATALLFAGCNYQGPLTDKPTRDVDSALLGSWFSLSDGSSLDIYRLSAQEYLVVDNGIPYVCTHSDLAGTSFVSCQQIQNDKDSYGKYTYVAYKLKKGILTLYSLNSALKIDEKTPAVELHRIVEEAAKKGTALETDPAKVIQYKLKAN